MESDCIYILINAHYKVCQPKHFFTIISVNGDFHNSLHEHVHVAHQYKHSQ